MGTSGIYDGPKDKNPLLPDWLDDSEDQEEDDNEELKRNGSWQNAKTQMSHYISGSNKNIKNVFRSYVRAHGSAKGASKTAISGKSTAISLGRALNSIGTIGFAQTLRNFGVEYSGRSLISVLSDFANKIAPHGALKEEDVARKAFFDSIEYFYDIVGEKGNSIEELDYISGEELNKVMEKYLSSYLFERMLNDLASRIEQYGNNAKAIEDDIEHYIEGKVSNKLSNRNIADIDYNSPDVNKLVDEIFKDCYEVLEGSI